MILDGTLQAGQKAPSESTLVKEHGVSKMTARNALVSLRDEGLLESQHGRGFFVRSFEPIRRNVTKRLAEELWGGGHSMWSLDVVDRDLRPINEEPATVEVPASFATLMGLEPGALVCQRARVYEVDGVPVMAATSYIPLDLAQGTPIMQVDTGAGGLYARLADIGHKPRKFREELKSQMPSPEIAQKLRMTSGSPSPVIHIVRTAADEKGRVVEINDMVLVASRYVLEYDYTT
ncbi:GntR family transcriptional regulator [Streptomyces sp. NEAU-H3]|nr:GntR family transcriptional regulator [Streptomyces sp. NEAU-H3]